jgi:WD40 repeat protein
MFLLWFLSSAEIAFAIEPAFGFKYRGHTVVEMELSPDGQNVAVVTHESEDIGADKCRVRVYKVPSGTLVREFATDARRCAWSTDGSVLALARSNGLDVDLWDSNSWTIKQTLHVTYPKNIVQPEPKVARLCFDQTMNLYAAEFELDEAGGFGTTYEFSPRVWWNIGGRWRQEADLFGSCSNPTPFSVAVMPYDISVASSGRETRVAVIYWACAAQILRVRERPGDKRIVEPEYSFRLGPASIKLTPEGKYLAAFDCNFAKKDTKKSRETVKPTNEPAREHVGQFHLFRLFRDRAELIEKTIVELPPLLPFGSTQILDVSHDGRFAAYCTARRVEVVRVPTCRSVLLIQLKPDAATAIAFSPDNHFLAVADRERRNISFYRIPLVVPERRPVQK